MGRRSQRLAVGEAAVTRTPTPEPEPVVNKEKKRKKSHKKPDKENRLKDKQTASTGDSVFKRKREDGSTSLAILTPGEGVIPGTEKDRPISLGNYLGNVRYGAGSIQGFKEDRRNQAKPMYPIFYPGGYSSHGPTYDSTFANLTTHDSKIVAPYFDFRKYENEDLIQNVCDEDYSEHFVDHLLDLLNGKDMTDTVVTSNSKSLPTMDEEINFDYLSTLESEGIDMSFLSNLQAHYELKNEPERSGLSITDQLELTAQLIQNLQSVQNKRMSVAPPANLNALAPPSSREMKLAERLVTGLSRLTSQVSPGQVAGVAEVRQAMGVMAPSIPPPPQAASEDSINIEDDSEVIQCNTEAGLTNGHPEVVVETMET